MSKITIYDRLIIQLQKLGSLGKIADNHAAKTLMKTCPNIENWLDEVEADDSYVDKFNRMHPQHKINVEKQAKVTAMMENKETK